MKLNWKLALMCLATFAMVACNNDKNDPTPGPGPEPGPGPDPKPDPEYVSPIDVKDNSVADWDALPADKVAVATITEDPYHPAMKMLKVYSDGVYINYMFEFDPARYVNRLDISDGMHIYINVDNDNETGGFYDLFADAGADLMFEGALFNQGTPIPYSPAMYRWVGPEGGLPEERSTDAVGGWNSAWELLRTVKGESQLVGDNIIEGRLIVGLISDKFAPEGFGIGFDIQQNWEGIGLLPQLDAQGKEGDLIGRTNMLFVPFDETEEPEEAE